MAEPPWGPLEPLEEELLDAAAKGRPCRPLVQDDATMQGDSAGQMIRAEVLRHLLVNGQWPVDPKGIELHSVLIHGFLDLGSAAVRCPVRFEACADLGLR